MNATPMENGHTKQLLGVTTGSDCCHGTALGRAVDPEGIDNNHYDRDAVRK